MAVGVPSPIMSGLGEGMESHEGHLPQPKGVNTAPPTTARRGIATTHRKMRRPLIAMSRSSRERECDRPGFAIAVGLFVALVPKDALWCRRSVAGHRRQ